MTKFTSTQIIYEKPLNNFVQRLFSVFSYNNALIAAHGQPDAMHGDTYIYFVNGEPSIGFSFEIEGHRVHEITMGVIRSSI